MIATEVKHQVNLIDGEFTPSEAKDVINTLIREKVNFHKLNRLSMWEGDTQSDTSFDDGRISQLLQSKEDFIQVYNKAKAAGKKVKLTGVVHIELID